MRIEPSQIIKTILDNEGLTQTGLAEKIGVSNSSITDIIVGRTRGVSERIINGINKAFDNKYSYTWLKSGTGEMLANESVSASNHFASIPLVETHAYAGYLAGYSDRAYLNNLPKRYIAKEMNMPSPTIGFSISGESMDANTSDSILSGDKVYCDDVTDVLEQMERTYHKWSYVIVHNDGIVCKRIKSIDKERKELVLHSLNPIYSDFVVKSNDIRRVFRVIKIERSVV